MVEDEEVSGDGELVVPEVSLDTAGAAVVELSVEVAGAAVLSVLGVELMLPELCDVVSAGALCCALFASVAGRAEVDGVFVGVAGEYGLEAELGELLLGTEVCAMLNPALVTSATTAAMLKVLDPFFICLTPFP